MMRPPPGIGKSQSAAVVAVSAVMLTAVYSLVVPGAGVRERDVTGRPVQIPADGYVSSQTCRACHPSQFASWHGSYHRTMTQIASPDTVATSFDAVTVEAIPGEPMVLEQRAQQLWAEFVDPDTTGSVPGQTPRIKRQVVMSTPSPNPQIYW
jgi:hypothetical protein